MASIVKRVHEHQTTFYVAYRVDGHLVRKRIGRSEALANKVKGEIEAKLERKEANLLPRDCTLQKLFQGFETHQEQRNSAGYLKRCQSVLKNLRLFLRRKHPGLKRASQLSPHLIKDYLAWRRAGEGVRRRRKDPDLGQVKHPIKKRTLNIELFTLKTMLNLAVEDGLLNANPIALVGAFKTDDSKPIRSLVSKQVQAVLRISPEWFKPILEIAVYTGMREGEIVHLEWGEVDLEKQVIHIRQRPGWNPKSPGGSIRERDIYLEENGVRALRELKLKSGRYPDKRVFRNSIGKPLIQGLRKTFMRLTKKCGFPEVTAFHALRHTYGTRLAAKSRDLVAVQGQMGHRNIKTTMRYVDLAEEQKRRAVETLNYDEEPAGSQEPAPMEKKAGRIAESA